MLSRPRVAITRRLPESVERQLAADFEVTINATDVPSTPASLVEALRTADGILCTLPDRFTADVLATSPRRARILAQFGAGYDNIDVDAARAAGLVVTNTPGVLTDDTADFTIALLLATARRMGEGERLLRSATWTGWRPTQMLGARVSGKTLGIVGFGRIGRAVARRAQQGLGMTVIAHSPSLPEGADAAPGIRRCASLAELLAGSDFVSLHCPKTPATRHLLGAAQFAQMKRSAMLINTARGDIVDEAALVQALATRTIAGAGLDVYEHEPAVPPELLALEHLVLMPHLGSATIESRTAMGERALANLRAFFAGEAPPDLVP